MMSLKKNIPPIIERFLAALALLGLILAAYLLWARPYQMHWGATTEEISRSMPGDELNRSPTFLATRAITISGTPRQIWPWLVQMGYGRAGYYGYDILEDLGSIRGIRSADRILPEFQSFKVGDAVPISPAATDIFYAIMPEEYLIWGGATPEFPGGFTWALYPLDANHTRLVSRIGWSHHWKRPVILALETLTEFSDQLAIRKILEGVKGRVEGHNESFASTTSEFAIYLSTLLLFFPVAPLLLLVRPLTWPRWLACLGAGIGWLITWYAPIPPSAIVTLGLLVLAAFYLAFFRSAQHVTAFPQTSGDR
ncbi:MAG TPA: hypothetical protein VE398_17470 [Acidobacteriota bacterium]|nr:hypothetical protein [Acidobacteriota bacterium]